MKRIAAIFLLFVAFAPPAAAAVPPDVATRFINALANQAIATMADRSVPVAAREARLRVLLRTGFDMGVISRFVVGRYWKRMSAQQQADYRALFSEWTLKNYASRLGGYANQKFEIIKTIESGKKDIFVRTLLVEPGNSKGIRCDWRVRTSKETGQPVIVDVVVEGISMLVTQKAEFATVLKRGGVGGLIEMLRVRLSKFQVLAGG